MKIVDVVCSAGRTGFYFDDQRAIKQGAGHDGMFYVGTPVTEGFRSIRQAGEWVYVSGHGPEDINTYEPLYRGRVGEALTLAQGRLAAAECGKTLLRAIQERYGTLDCIAGLVRALVLVNCGDGFQDIGAVADGFSDLCVEVLQERGRHVRTVMGTRNMPNHNIPVEVELIYRLAEGYGEEA